MVPFFVNNQNEIVCPTFYRRREEAFRTFLEELIPSNAFEDQGHDDCPSLTDSVILLVLL